MWIGTQDYQTIRIIINTAICYSNIPGFSFGKASQKTTVYDSTLNTSRTNTRINLSPLNMHKPRQGLKQLFQPPSCVCSYCLTHISYCLMQHFILSVFNHFKTLQHTILKFSQKYFLHITQVQGLDD